MSGLLRLLTINRVGLILWAITMVLLISIPQRYWHYPDDLWLRLLVIAPAMASLGLWSYDGTRRLIRGVKQARSEPALWQGVEEDAVSHKASETGKK